MADKIATRRIRCLNCSTPLTVGVPLEMGRTRRIVTLCRACNHDLVVSRGQREDEGLRIRACLRWDVDCPYCKASTVARLPPKGLVRRKETTPCQHCRKPLIVERREAGQIVLRAHRGILEGVLL